jgi:hypothetical protein
LVVKKYQVTIRTRCPPNNNNQKTFCTEQLADADLAGWAFGDALLAAGEVFCKVEVSMTKRRFKWVKVGSKHSAMA